MRDFLFNQKMSFFLCFFFLVSSFSNTFVSATQHWCHPDQRDALIEFKTEFEIRKPAWDYSSWIFSSEDFSYPKTKSWVNNSDCCSWDGITCDVKSGKVIGLDLSGSCLYGELKPSSSLFRLRHLRDLNLAYNNFTASPVPVEFEKLKGLQRLNLSKSSFSGQIPNKLLQLTKLVSLDLSSFSPRYIYDFEYLPNSLSIDESFLRLLARNLRNLRDLDMSIINISSEIPHEFSTMWSLRSLRFEGCSLFGEFPSNVFLIPNLQSISLDGNLNLRVNLPVFHGNNSIQILSLSYTSCFGPIPESISNLKHLLSLELTNSHFSGRIPSSIGNLSRLSYLDLSLNYFIGEIPFSIGDLKQLTHFDVSLNSLSGNFPSSLLNSTQLRYIDLGANQLTGFLPPNISQLSKLEYFNAGMNSFVGAIPSSLFTISSLTHIYLYDNKFNDLLGIENISLLPNLQALSLVDNNFNVSPVDLNVFSPLKELVMLSLSGIPLSTTNITSDSDFLSHLERLELSGCNITEFPQFIRNQRHLQSLRLSNNKIKGQVPAWFTWKLAELFSVDLSRNSLSGFHGSLSKASSASSGGNLNISCNAFQGPLFIPSRSIGHYYAYSNNFTGEIPQSICGIRFLKVLDISNNNLHGSIPRCLKTQLGSLSELTLSNNSFNGSLPDIFMNAESLRVLDVGHNRLEGKLPASLTSCSSLEFLNVESNGINDTFPFQLNSLQNLQVLVLRSNKFHGRLHKADGVWDGFPELKIIDASHNDFFGSLPSDYFINWTAISVKRDDNEEPEYIRGFYWYYASTFLMSRVSMKMERIYKFDTAIDFSGNQLHGPIPDSIGLLKELRMLDFSRNAFTGHIPSSLANLTVLDLSNNNFRGSIPRCLETMMGTLSDLNLRNNSFSGSLPDMFINAKELHSLDVGHNRLEGKLPASLTSCSALEVLNVESNGINDTFPFQLKSLQNLQVLVLRSNKFHGRLHKADGVWDGFPELKIIDASHNDFFGSLPSDYFINWTAISVKRDDNEEPEYIHGDVGYYSLVLMSKGVSMEMERILTIYTAIDFSGNQLHGKIPKSIGLLKELRILNLSRNAFTGHIPPSLANLTNLESLDLSQNKISGEIPPELGTLSSLAWINVSHNQLVGLIPQSTQFQRQNCSSYEGNPGIFGPSLKDVCGDNHHAPTSEQSEVPESSEEEDEEWFSWRAVGFGLVPGVVFGLTMG